MESLEHIRDECKDIYDLGQPGPGMKDFFLHNNYQTIDINENGKPDIIGDVHHLPLPDNSADAILASSLLEHCHSPHIVVEEMKRVLRPRGRIFITVPFIHPYHGGLNRGTYCPDYYRFTKDGVMYLFRDFEIEITSDGGFFTSMSYFLPKLKFLKNMEFLYSNGKSRHQYFVYGYKQ